MGRTALTARQIMDMVEKRYRSMEKIMCHDDSEKLEEIIRSGRRHSPEISYAGEDVEIGILLFSIIEILNRLKKLESENKP
ncbi:hypothetical protein OXIME_001420 [Oxyplasma meridianum]|uniref:DUF8156 domain-containing protein n=1 Tax=Oxyplasma meridianum TaxID=3073602 RepID=A0AAX4NJ82_9ARCH